MSAVLRLVRDDGSDDDGLSLLEQYEIHLRGAGRSERWIEESLWTLGRLEQSAGKPVDACTAMDVSRFLAGMRLTAGSRATYFRQLNGFYRWWSAQGGRFVTALLPRPREPVHEPRPISSAELRRLLELRMHRRTRVMILLAAFAGLRVHEIAQFRGEHINLDRNTIRVTGKGGRTDTLPLHPLLAGAAATMPRRGIWFPANSTRRGEHVHRRSVSDIIVQAMRRADINATPHALRHWFATALLESGCDVRTVQTLMRHAGLATTARYMAVTDARRVEGIALLDPFREPDTRTSAAGDATAEELRRRATELLSAAEELERNR